LAARKGGVGKSSLARALSVQAAIDGMRSAIIDADDQQTIIKWGKRRSSPVPAVVELRTRTIPQAVRDLSQRACDICFIDCPPHNQPSINVAVEVADFAIVITEPAAESIEQIAAVVQIVTSLGRRGGLIINKANPKSIALTAARAAMTAFPLPLCPQALTSLLVHSYSAAEGQAPQEREPDGKAAKEIEAVWSWVKGFLG